MFWIHPYYSLQYIEAYITNILKDARTEYKTHTAPYINIKIDG